MATGAEKEYKAAQAAAAQSSLMNDRSRAASVSRRGSFGMRRLRSGGSMAGYQVGSLADDPVTPAKPGATTPPRPRPAKPRKRVAPAPRPRTKPKPKAKAGKAMKPTRPIGLTGGKLKTPPKRPIARARRPIPRPVVAPKPVVPPRNRIL